MIPMHTDGCTQCITEETTFIEPTRIVDADGSNTVYAYKCPKCGHSWQTGWANDTPDLPEGHPKRRASAE